MFDEIQHGWRRRRRRSDVFRFPNLTETLPLRANCRDGGARGDVDGATTHLASGGRSRNLILVRRERKGRRIEIQQ
jgi:hypothetical protein